MLSSAGGRDPRREEDERWMRRAIALATENVQAGAGPFGAVIVRGDAGIAEGQNRVAIDNDPSAHAEVVAIRRACAALGTFSLEGCILYTSCAPCPMCLGAILWSRCAEFYFGNTTEDAAAAGFADASYYAQICSRSSARELRSTNLLRQEAAASFKAWAELPDRIVY